MISDVSRLKIILNNLISNALKFQKNKKNEAAYIKISISEIENTYQLIVEDNGSGIAPEHQKAIFEMFFRGTSNVHGSGLGF